MKTKYVLLLILFSFRLMAQDMKFEFSKINNLSENESQIFFTTDNGIKLSFSKEGYDGAIRRAYSENEKTFLVYNSKGICNLVTPFTEFYPTNIEEDKEFNSLKIWGLPRPSPFYLHKNSPNFEKIHNIIKKAIKEEQLIWVGALPPYKILDVFVPEKLQIQGMDNFKPLKSK